MTKDFVLGKFDYKNDSTFLKVNPPYSAKAVYLNNQVVNSFLEMYQAAMADGIELKIISGTRNFEEQKVIWERKWKMYQNLEPLARALKILEYSSMPSSSRHHWGTDIDLNSINNSYFHSGKGLKAYQWLKTYANAYGFYQVYTEKDQNRTGYNLEKWHWSYLPLASKYLAFYNKQISTSDITGFSGYDQAQEVMIIKNYVNGISKMAKEYK
jgi:LAS superfamily LD-carboxypeptidase LdcB